MKKLSFFLGFFLLLFLGCHKYDFNTDWSPYLGEWENGDINQMDKGYRYIQLSSDARYKYQLNGLKDETLTLSGKYKIEGNKLNFITIERPLPFWEMNKPLIITKQPYTDSLGKTHLILNDIDYVKK